MHWKDWHGSILGQPSNWGNLWWLSELATGLFPGIAPTIGKFCTILKVIIERLS
jgi:hypothetical protein